MQTTSSTRNSLKSLKKDIISLINSGGVIMKKVFLLTGIVMLYAASAFATAAAVYTTTTGAATTLGITGFAQSKNVGSAYVSGTVLGSGFAYYAIATKHTSGSKKFGAISTDSGTYALDSAAAVIVTGDLPTLPTTSTAVVTGWTSM